MSVSITLNAEQIPADVAVVLPTILRPALLRAAQSVFSQEFNGRIHLLIGIDVAAGETAVLDEVRARCPANMMFTVLDLGYSTSQRHGGIYSNYYSGALRAILSVAANARYIAYLDDNDWFRRDHLASLWNAVQGKDWAFSRRWLADEGTLLPICRDEWDSVGPDHGINSKRFGGFTHPSTLLVDKLRCDDVLPLWSHASFSDGTGEDRRVFAALRANHSWADTGAYTCFCTLSQTTQSDEHHRREFAARGIAWNHDQQLIGAMANSLAQAHAAAAMGRWSATIDACRDVLRINPYHAEALAWLAQGLLAISDARSALEALHTALDVDDSSDALYVTLAQAHRAAGDHSSGDAAIARGLRRFPTSTALLNFH